jgi:phosphotriesterase-related protein
MSEAAGGRRLPRWSREQLVGKVQTVLGLIPPEDLGPTLLHEHVLVDIRPPGWKHLQQIGRKITLRNRFFIDYGEVTAPGNCVLNDERVAASELGSLYESGGRSVVELSCGGLHPDPRGLQRVAEQSGIHVIMGCGHYVEEYQAQANHDRSVDDFAEEIVDQIQLGAWGSEVRAGIIGEIGCQAPWTPLEQRVMKAAAIAQKETGAAISVHPGRDPDQPLAVAEFLAREGADLSRVIISHIDRTIFDDERLYRLADSGVVIEFDLFGMETSYYKLNEAIDMPNDAQRIRTIRRLADRGHLAQIAISHDICYQSRLCCNGGHGYGHIFRNVVPMMLRRGFTEGDVDQILKVTPARLLTFV